jgi:hypothetical protein
MEMLADLVIRHAGGWTDKEVYPVAGVLRKRKERAVEMGAKR